MEKQKFKSILLLAIFSLTFILGGCSSNTLQGDSSNGTVVEVPASSYCKNDTHMYAPDPSIEGKLIDCNSEDGSFTTLLDNSTGAKTYFDSVVVYEGNIYCGLQQSNGEYVGTNDFLLKVNLETKQYSQYDIGSNELWQADSNIYFTAVDSENKMGIYKLDLKQDKMTNLYTDNDNYGEISISYIQNQTIYFIKKLSVPGNHILCSVQLDGKDYKEYCEYPRIWNAFPIDNKIYFYALNESGGKNATYEFDNKTNTSVKAEIPLKGQLRLHNGYVYGSFTSETNKFGLYRLPIDNLSAQPEFVSDKGTKIIDFTDDFVIISDGAGEDDVTPNNENPNYFVTNVDGSSSERCWDLFSAYQYAFGFSSASGNEESSSESESSNGFTIPDELTQLFDETVVDIYGDNPLPKPLFSEGGSNCYQAPDSEATMYYFSISESGEAYSYLLAIEGPLNLLIPGKDTATIAELKELFGDSFSFNFSDNMGGYTASAQIGEYGISFGTFESEENATVTAFRISK